MNTCDALLGDFRKEKEIMGKFRQFMQRGFVIVLKFEDVLSKKPLTDEQRASADKIAKPKSHMGFIVMALVIMMMAVCVGPYRGRGSDLVRELTAKFRSTATALSPSTAPGTVQVQQAQQAAEGQVGGVQVRLLYCAVQTHAECAAACCFLPAAA